MNRRMLAKGLSAWPALLWPGGARAQLVDKHAEQLKPGEFNWHPERSQGGPLLIIVSIPDQLVHVYRNGIRVAASSCSTGKPGHATPAGVFKILQKDKNHRSSSYNNAPMPNMNRLTWSGIALHAGNLPGYPASHGCVRLPLEFSSRLFGITKLGMTVVIADAATQPAAVVHPGMILGDYARREFQAVDTSVVRSQYAAGHDDEPDVTSVVVSGRDRSVTVYENEKIVAIGQARIQNPGRPLPNAVHTLRGKSSSTGELQWSSVRYGKTGNEDLLRDLRRIKADDDVREQIRRRAHLGMTVVTTNERQAGKTSQNKDFVVIDSLY